MHDTASLQRSSGHVRSRPGALSGALPTMRHRQHRSHRPAGSTLGGSLLERAGSRRFLRQLRHPTPAILEPLACFEGFEHAPHPIQQWTSDVCGDHVLYYLYHGCRSTPLAKIVHYFSPSNLLYNDTAVVQRMHDLFPSLMSEQHAGGHLFDARGHSQICIQRHRHRCYAPLLKEAI